MRTRVGEPDLNKGRNTSFAPSEAETDGTPRYKEGTTRHVSRQETPRRPDPENPGVRRSTLRLCPVGALQQFSCVHGGTSPKQLSARTDPLLVRRGGLIS